MYAKSGFWREFGRQLGRPAGWRGRLLGRYMALVNRVPNRMAIAALGVAPHDTVLELGFGPGQAIKTLGAQATQGRVLGVDFSPDMLKLASQANRRAIASGRVRLTQGRFEDLPFEDGSIDKILASNVVYFFREDGADVREARRVLRPGGVMVAFATDRATMAGWKFYSPETHRLFSRDDLKMLFMRGGFSADEITVREVALPLKIKGLLAVVVRRA